MRRRTELYWIGRGETSPPTFRYPGHTPASPQAGDGHARYPMGWADDRLRFPGEIALRDIGAASQEEHPLVLARFAFARWVQRLLEDAPAWEADAERQAAHDYAAAALPPGNRAPGPPDGPQATGPAPQLRHMAADTLRELTESPGPQASHALLNGLRQASGQAAALHHPGGALSLGRLGYMAALRLGQWDEARWFARELARYVGEHGAGRLAGRWVRRARALEKWLDDSTTGRA